MMWTYEYRDRPRPCYRVLDGSDDGDVAECWDEDVARAIVQAMNEATGVQKCMACGEYGCGGACCAGAGFPPAIG